MNAPDPTFEETARLMKRMGKFVAGKTIEEIAPVLVVTVARMLMVEAGNDPEKLAFLTFKFINSLGQTVAGMATEEGFGEPRQ